jgi:branched-chain amino acid transport system substrate-binding protein
MRRIPGLLVGAILLLAPQAVTAADPFEINVILPLTGAGAFIGKEEVAALEVLEASVNKSGGISGRPIKFVVVDDQSNPQLTVQLANQVIAKKASVLLGPSFVATCNALAPLVATSGPVTYCFSPGIHPSEGQYLFSSSLSTGDLLSVAALYFSERGIKKIGIITSTDATGQDAERNIDLYFGESGKRGESIVAREHFNTTDLSATAQMTRIKVSGAQAVIAWSTGTPFATLLRSFQEAGLEVPLMTTSGNLTYAQMKAYAGIMPKELYFAAIPSVVPDQVPRGPVKNTINAYLNTFKAIGVRPDIGQSLAWDPAILVIDALKKYGLNATATQIRDYISSQRNWTGVNGTYDFKAIPQRGVGPDWVMMVKWDPAKDSWVAVSRPGGMPLK